MSLINPDCDGERCTGRTEVRLYPLGSGGNLILCERCFRHENKWRAEQGKRYERPWDWPQVDWNRAIKYGEENATEIR